MNNNFFDGHDELYHHSKFGEDRTMRAVCRCENVVFVFVCLFVGHALHESGAACVRWSHSSNKHCVAVYCPISTRFSTFFPKGLLFYLSYIVLIFVASRRHNFRELLSKIAKIRKIGGKIGAHPKSHIGRGSKFSKIYFEQLYAGWIVVVHLYCDFSLWRQMAPQLSAKFRTAFFGQFRTSLRKHSVASYAWI